MKLSGSRRRKKKVRPASFVASGNFLPGPGGPLIICIIAGVAQLGEQLICNQQVASSNLVIGLIKIYNDVRINVDKGLLYRFKKFQY